MLERLEERTRELATARARLKDPDCDDDDFLEFRAPPRRLGDSESRSLLDLES